jgi:hypothetical protein
MINCFIMNHNSVVKMMKACSSIMVATPARPQSVITPNTAHSSVMLVTSTKLHHVKTPKTATLIFLHFVV